MNSYANSATSNVMSAHEDENKPKGSEVHDQQTEAKIEKRLELMCHIINYKVSQNQGSQRGK